MRVSALSTITLSLLFIQSSAHADSILDIANQVKSQGWFKSCSQALPRLNSISEPSPSSPDWKVYIKIKAGCLSELRRDAEAIAYINKKLPDAKNDSEISEYLGTSYIRLGSFDKATEVLEASLIGADNSRLSEIYSKLALSYSQQATQLSPTDTLEQTRVLKKAESAALEAIKLGNPAAPHFYTQLGQIQILKGDFVAAENTLNLALSVNESYKWEKLELKPIMEAEILMAQSQARRYQGDDVGADYMAEEAIRKSPTESLKIVMQQIHEASKTATSLQRKSHKDDSGKHNLLNQIYIPLDEDI
ncbi:hypothetical protein PSEWESI4_01703 [Pseudomonas carbonaria]|uniref:Tetratricopeptide repeat protein n=2 Tax=Zestomonas carbonaria TaxID=2762745 RepID=A0A7U7ELZ9_9GAMM|nr:hypothetical protein PSEWESI4_01703 [Pseudomonas carbonaria]